MALSKEYGGYLPLELSKGAEWYQSAPNRIVLGLDCGRSAFHYAVRDAGAKRVFLPYYTCELSADPIRRAGAEVVFYLLNDDLLPRDIVPEPSDLVLWVNYFGNATQQQIDSVVAAYPRLILDNCTAFFSPPVSGVYSCYSLRKFFGVCDGAYLIKEQLQTFPLEQDFSYPRAQHLLRSIEQGTNAAYGDSLDNESRLGHAPKAMSTLTRRIAQSIDYPRICQLRHANLLRLHERLSPWNRFPVNTTSFAHHLYPLLTDRPDLRQVLIDQCIYTPTCWRHVPAACGFAPLETSLSDNLVFLPIDQRYSLTDMDELAAFVLKLLYK